MFLLDLDPATPRKGAGIFGEQKNGGSTSHSLFHDRSMSISRDTFKKQFSLQLRSVAPKETGMYYCARNTVWEDLIVSSDKNPPLAALRTRRGHIKSSKGVKDTL
jgi:hypothetical protein